MIKSKLLAILKVLSEEEMQYLQAFLNSPYFHQTAVGEDEHKLFDYLHRQHPEFEEKLMAKESVYREVYPKTDYIKGKLEKRMTYLLKRVRQFMVLEELKQEGNEFVQTEQLARFYRRKGLQHLYEVHLGSWQKSRADLKAKDTADLLHDYLMQREIAEYKSLYNSRRHDNNLVNSHEALDNFYLSSKLEYACALVSQSNFHSEVDLHNSLQFLTELESLLKDENNTQLPLVKVFAHIYFTLQELQATGMVELSSCEALEAILDEYESYLPFDLLKSFQAYNRSFYAHYSNTGHQSFRAKIFSLYQEHLEKGFLFYHGGLTPSVYQNIVNLGLDLKQHEWVLNFLQQYQSMIVGTRFPETIYALNMANYHFSTQHYDQALDLLLHDQEDLYYQIAARRMEIKIYYEQESVLLSPKINAFHLFLRRLSKKKIPESQRKSNFNFVNAIKQILLPKTFNNPERITKLQEKIEANPMIKDKRWLLEKLTRMNRKPSV